MTEADNSRDRGTDRIVVAPDQAGSRLDRLITSLERVGSRSRARELVASGKVTVDGKKVGGSDGGNALAAGSVVEIAWNRPGTGRDQVRARFSIEEANLKILYEDDHILCVDKPSGLLTDAATEEQRRERDTVVHRLRRYLKPQGVTPFVGHRIDRDTSGVIAFAKHERAWERLRAQFHARTPERVYWAVLQGIPQPRSGLWVDDMVWDDQILAQRPARPGEHGAVLASANYAVEQVFSGGLSQVEVRLVTGRRNQIRLHAMLRGFPLVGERLYTGHDFRAIGPRVERHALHARRLGFEHPITGDRVLVESPLPPDMLDLISKLGPPG